MIIQVVVANWRNLPDLVCNHILQSVYGLSVRLDMKEWFA